jgi:crotonobetainyl-CoA:carnitine CoA-transferase CaiB-like acyl-CoA transferase
LTSILHNIRVLDFGRYISAPYCGMLLADMGADVIRVERPGGDEDRHFGLTAANGENLTFPGLARNKKGMTLDLSSSEGRGVLKDLVASADVFLHNFSPSAVRALQITYRDIQCLKPDIIYTGISCFGNDGPKSDLAGFDAIAQMTSGAAALTGYDDSGPLRSGVPWVDYSTGLHAALGTVLGLLHRARSGQGQEVNCALLGTAVSCTAPMIAESVVIGTERPRLGNRTPYLGPSDLFDCTDGKIFVAIVTRGMWHSMAKLIGRPDLLDRPEYATDMQRYERRSELDPLVQAWCRRLSVGEAATLLSEARVPFGVYSRLSDVPNDPQVRVQDMLEYIDLGTAGLHRVPVSGIPIKLSKTPGGVRCRSPRVGEHNDELLRELGYSDARIGELRERGII